MDDNVPFRTGLRALLEKEGDLVVAAEAGTGDEAVACTIATRPDVVLMDLSLPGKGGLEATREILRQDSNVSVLVLTVFPQSQLLLDALEAGALGFVEKDAPLADLTRGIRIVARGHRFLGADASKYVALQRYRREARIDAREDQAQRAGGRPPGVEHPKSAL